MAFREIVADEAKPNLTPMIDMTFLLVVFFMITIDLSQKEFQDVALPFAKNGVEDVEALLRAERGADRTRSLLRELGFGLSDAHTGGGSDANTTAGVGVPSLDGLGPVGGNDHSPLEYIETSSIVPRTTLLAALVLSVGR